MRDELKAFKIEGLSEDQKKTLIETAMTESSKILLFAMALTGIENYMTSTIEEGSETYEFTFRRVVK